MATVLISITLVVGGFLVAQEGLQSKKLLWLILICGLIMRVCYAIATPATVRAHDLGILTTEGNGHAAYILNLVEGRFPTTNEGQFYQAPLFHILSALLICIVKVFHTFSSEAEMIEVAKVVSCAASCGVLFLSYQICKELKLGHFGTILAVSLAAFLPNNYLLAGRVNNDSLVFFFMTLIVLYTIKWYHKQTLINTAILAVSFGLGMMTKISVGVLAVFTGIVMIDRGILWVKEKKWWGIGKKMLLFLGICAPLALWFPIRNQLLFSQPLTYVLESEMTGIVQCDQYSFIQRFIAIPIGQLFSTPFSSVYTDYNTNLYLIRGAAFGEFQMPGLEPLTTLLVLMTALMCLLVVFAVISAFFRKEDRMFKFYLPGVCILFYVSYIAFNIRYPRGFTMDYRYIMPIGLVGAILVGRLSQCIMEKGKRNARGYKVVVGIAGTIFSILSVVTYCKIL